MRSLRYNVTDTAYNEFTRFHLELKQQNNIDISLQECMIYLLSNLPKVPLLRPDTGLKAGIDKAEGGEMWKKLSEDQRRTIKLISLGMLQPSEKDKKIIAMIKSKT